MNTHKFLLIAAGFLSLIPAPRALSDTHTESPDAGVTEATAQQLSVGITEIHGVLGPGTEEWDEPNPRDVDVFYFTIEEAINGASIQVFADNFNANLLLLREGFFGVWGDDGSGVGGADSGIVTNLAPGTYYIATGVNNTEAYSSSAVTESDYIWGNDNDQLTPPESTVPIAFIGAGEFAAEENEPYRIVFNFATSDDPATAAAKAAVAAQKLALENKIKKLKKKIKKSKGTTKSKKFKKKLKKLKKQLKALG